jgi:hypothetical protein
MNAKTSIQSSRFLSVIYFFWVLLFTCFSVMAFSQDDITWNQSSGPGDPNEDYSYPPVAFPATLSESISLIGAAPSTVAWAFDAIPSGATKSVVSNRTQFEFEGVTVTLPGVEDTPVSSTGTIDISGGSAQETSFSFTLLVTDEDGDFPTTREYSLVIRRGVSLVLVLDRSGSMSSTSDVTGGNRWNALKTSVGNFMNKMGTTGFFVTGDEVGITYFHNVTEQPPTFTTTFIPINASSAGLVNADMNTKGPGTSTAMGEGIVDAISNKLTNTNKIRNVLLFTDGRQNDGRLVNLGGTDIGTGPTAFDIDTPPSEAGDVKIYSIGIGNPDVAYHTTLFNLANSNRGAYFTTSNGSSFTYISDPADPLTNVVVGDINQVFASTYFEMFHEYSPQCIRYFTTELNSSPTEVELLSFPANAGLDGFMFEILFDRNLSRGELIELLSQFIIEKDGLVLNPLPPSIVGNVANGGILAFDLQNNRFNTQGNWALKYRGEIENYEPLGVTISTIVNDHRLKFAITENNGAQKVDDTFDFSTTVSYKNQPIEDASLRAVIVKPGSNIGDLLANNEFIVDASSGGDAPLPGTQKHQALLESNDSDYLDALLASGDAISFSHNGGGQYSADYNQIDVSGIYQLIFILQFTHPEDGEIERISFKSSFIRFGDIDLSKSSADYASTSGPDGTYTTITFSPVWSHGGNNYYAGVSLGDAIKWESDGSQLYRTVEDQRGGYTLSISGDTGEKGKLMVLDQTVFEGRLKDIACFDSEDLNVIQKIQCWLLNMGLPIWLIWLILGLLIIIIIWLIIRRRNS